MMPSTKIFSSKLRIKEVVLALVILMLLSTASVAEEFQLVLPIEDMHRNVELLDSIKQKFPFVESVLNISVSEQGQALQIGPLESESLAKALAAEFSEQGFHSAVVSTSQVIEALAQPKNVLGDKPDADVPDKNQTTQETTDPGQETLRPEPSPSSQIVGSETPTDALSALETKELDAPVLAVSGEESEAAEEDKGENNFETTVPDDQPLRLEPPSSRQKTGGETSPDTLISLDFQDLDAPAVQEGSFPGAQAVSSTLVVFNDENYLLLELLLGNIILAANVTGYVSNGITYLPFHVFLRNVGFPISVNNDFNSARGWFISKQRTFILNRKEGYAVIAGKKIALDGLDFADDGFALYISENALSRFFPIDIDVSLNDLTATIIPKERLPIEDLLEKGRSGYRSGGYTVKAEMRNLEYALFEPSAAKITSIGSYRQRKGGDPQFRDKLIAEFSGDLAYFNTNVYAAGAIDSKYKNDHLESIRFTAKRIDPQKKLLGPLKASEVRLGDVKAVNFLGSSGSGRQRGVYITNRSLTREQVSLYDETSFSGNSLPDWDVELYRNDMLVDSITVGDDGLYEFTNVELLYGKNVFVVKQFGPQGELKQEEKIIDVGKGRIPPGEVKYQLSMTQQRSKTVEIDEPKATSDKGKVAGAVKADIGVSPDSTLSLGVDSHTEENIRHSYAHIGASHKLKDLANLHFEGQADTNGGQVAQGSVQVGFSPFSLGLKHREHFDKFEYPTIRSTSASISPRLDFLASDDVSLSASFSGSVTETKTTRSNGLGNALTLKLFKNTFLSNSLSSNYSEDKDGFLGPIAGKATFRGRYQSNSSSLLGALEIYGETRYSLTPIEKITEYNYKILDRWKILDNVSLFASFQQKRKDELSKPENLYGGGFRIRHGELVITPSVAFSDQGTMQATALFSLPLAINPRNLSLQYERINPNMTGGVSALVFLDKNYNFIFDGDDEPLENVAVSALQFRRKELTDSSGMALLNGLAANIPVDIDVIDSEEWDSSWVVRSDGEAVYPRSGKTYLLDFPVQILSEFDGMVMSTEGANILPYPSVPLELIRKGGEVVAETASEHDGFFIFQNVIPGDYIVRPKNDFLLLRDKYALPTEPIEATPEGAYESYLYIYIATDKRDLVKLQPDRVTGLSKELSVTGSFSSYEKAKEAGGMLSRALPGNNQTMRTPVHFDSNQAMVTYIHLESYEDKKSAREAISSLYEDHAILSSYTLMILEHNLPEGRTVYRVVAPILTEKQARRLAAHFKTIGKYANVVYN